MSIESKFIIVIRHGELYNPKELVYNRDSVMKSEDIMHLSQRGIEQMGNLGQLIAQKGFKIKKIVISPEIRAQESAKNLTEGHSFAQFEIDKDLDDTYAPGPYLMGMSMEQFASLGGNTYESVVWNGYNHETAANLAERMRRAFDKIAKSLNFGETGIIISHGDPLAWLLSDLIEKHLPQPKDLRGPIYPEKGIATVIVLNSNNQVIHHYKLNPEDAGSKY